MPHRNNTPAAACALLIALSGCASEPTPQNARTELPEVPGQGLGVGLDELEARQIESDTRLADPEQPELPDLPGARSFGDWEEAMQSNVYDLDPLLDEPLIPTRDDARAPAAQSTARATPPVNELTPLVGGPADVFASVETEPTIDAAPASDLEPDLQELLRTLERMTGDDALASGLPLGPALQAAALEILTPGALERALGRLDDDSPFTPDERELLRAWADLHRDVKLADADPMEIARLLRQAADEAGALLPMHIKRLELCSAVESYGAFTPLFRQDDAVLMSAGRARKMIVYAEIDRFSTPTTTRNNIDGHEVDLRQTLELVHLDKGDGSADLIAWSQPEERITDFSRNRRRDFYTVQIIELPATLTIGKYHLRLTVTDAHSQEQAQSIVPIDVVALTDITPGR